MTEKKGEVYEAHAAESHSQSDTSGAPGTSDTMQRQGNRPIKVLFVITKSAFGGAGRYVYELATQLPMSNVRNEDSGKTADNDTPAAAQPRFETAVALGGNGILTTKLEEAGIPVFPIRDAQRDMSLLKEAKVLIQLIRIIRKYKPDIIHLNSPKIGGLGAVAARLAGVKRIIYTNHGWPFKEPRPEWQLVLIRCFSWLTVFLNGTTIVLSDTEKRYVRLWPLIQKKFVIIPNGVTPFETVPRRQALERLLLGAANSTSGPENKAKRQELVEKILSNPKDWMVVGTISELHRNKGLTHAIEGLSLYAEQYPDRNIIFIIIGHGEERAKLEALIKEKHLENKVFLAGQIAPEARSYLSAFDIFLLSSVKEGLPFAILEAGYAGIPVISTSVGGIPEVIKNLENGMLIHPARPQEIKNAFIYIHDHPQTRATLSAEFKKRIEEKYTFHTAVLQKIKELYLK